MTSCWLLASILLLTVPSSATARLASNLDLITAAAEAAVRDALESVPLSPDGTPLSGALLLEPQDDHAANWLVEQLLIEQLLDAGIAVTVDAEGIDPQAPRLTYRVVDLGVTGRSRPLSGTIDRRCHVAVALHYSAGGELIAVREAKAQITDRVPSHQLEALQHSSYAFADTDIEKQSWARYAEPVIVTTILGSLIYLFFSNR